MVLHDDSTRMPTRTPGREPGPPRSLDLALMRMGFRPSQRSSPRWVGAWGARASDDPTPDWRPL